MVNWAELPDELIEMIAKQMNCVGDYVRFGCVCQSWRSVAACSVPSFSPWLILPEKQPPKEEEDDDDDIHEEEDNFEEEEYVVKTFFEAEPYIEVPKWFFHEERVLPRKFMDISSKRVTEFKLPEAHARRCMGSAYGWLLTIGLDLNIHFLNPLTRHQIPLPSQPTFKGHYYRNQDPTDIHDLFFIKKFALSSHPTHPSCVVMVVYSSFSYCDRLAYTTPGDKSWKFVKTSFRSYQDIIFFNNLFYLVDSDGDIDLCDTSQPDPEVEFFMAPPPQITLLLEQRVPLYDYVRFYLVDVFGDFCLVLRILFNDQKEDRLFSKEFRVYKLDFSTFSWMELRNLHNYALFLGTNISFAISTSDKPQLKSNSIYFTDDYVDSRRGMGRDMGLFDLEENKMGDPLYGGDDILSMFCPPLYFTPNLIFE